MTVIVLRLTKVDRWTPPSVMTSKERESVTWLLMPSLSLTFFGVFTFGYSLLRNVIRVLSDVPRKEGSWSLRRVARFSRRRKGASRYLARTDWLTLSSFLTYTLNWLNGIPLYVHVQSPGVCKRDEWMNEAMATGRKDTTRREGNQVRRSVTETEEVKCDREWIPIFPSLCPLRHIA